MSVIGAIGRGTATGLKSYAKSGKAFEHSIELGTAIVGGVAVHKITERKNNGSNNSGTIQATNSTGIAGGIRKFGRGIKGVFIGDHTMKKEWQKFQVDGTEKWLLVICNLNTSDFGVEGMGVMNIAFEVDPKDTSLLTYRGKHGPTGRKYRLEKDHLVPIMDVSGSSSDKVRSLNPDLPPMPDEVAAQFRQDQTIEVADTTPVHPHPATFSGGPEVEELIKEAEARGKREGLVKDAYDEAFRSGQASGVRKRRKLDKKKAKRAEEREALKEWRAIKKEEAAAGKA